MPRKSVTIETPVGPRTVPEGSPWWKGDGRGHVREFITQDGKMKCRVCGDRQDETHFPTFTIPRKDGRRRSDECRECRDIRRTAEKAKAERSAKRAAKKVAGTRKAATARKAKAGVAA